MAVEVKGIILSTFASFTSAIVTAILYTHSEVNQRVKKNKGECLFSFYYFLLTCTLRDKRLDELFTTKDICTLGPKKTNNL